jgi:hypothetical protein
MKIFVETFRFDHAMYRIRTAIKKHLPRGYEYVETKEEADLIVVIAYNHKSTIRRYIEWVLANKKKYILLQLNLKNTNDPNASGWLPLWESAEQVWSYFDLMKACEEEGIDPNLFKFYHSPLGVDSTVFKEVPSKRIFKIAGSGNGRGWSKECKNEIIQATEGTDWKIFNLGFGEDTDRFIHSNDMPDEELVKYYSQCEFVSGLRRLEGFELPIIEGILCGARPICFNTPNFRQWFDGIAEFIPEDRNTSEHLRKLFEKGARPVSEDEKAYVRAKFDWQMILRLLWM